MTSRGFPTLDPDAIRRLTRRPAGAGGSAIFAALADDPAPELAPGQAVEIVVEHADGGRSRVVGTVERLGAGSLVVTGATVAAAP